MVLILLAQLYILSLYRPLNSQIRVIPHNGTFCLRMVKLVTLILEQCRLAQHHKTVSKAFGDKELAVILACNFNCYIFTVSG